MASPRPLSLRPALIAPLCYTAAAGFAVWAVIAVAVPGHPNHTLAARWFLGEFCAVTAWAFYKAGASRIVLRDDVMQVISWGLTRTVRRGDVTNVLVMNQTLPLAICLADGSWIRPVMFLSQPGLFPGMLRCESIADRIMAWNGEPPPLTEAAASDIPERRRWRPDLPLLIGMSVVVAVEAVTLTLVNVW